MSSANSTNPNSNALQTPQAAATSPWVPEPISQPLREKPSPSWIGTKTRFPSTESPTISSPTSQPPLFCSYWQPSYWPPNGKKPPPPSSCCCCSPACNQRTASRKNPSKPTGTASHTTSTKKFNPREKPFPNRCWMKTPPCKRLHFSPSPISTPNKHSTTCAASTTLSPARKKTMTTSHPPPPSPKLRPPPPSKSFKKSFSSLKRTFNPISPHSKSARPFQPAPPTSTKPPNWSNCWKKK